MAQCAKRQATKKRIPIGSMDRKIVIQVREITPAVVDPLDYTETFRTKKTVWANVQTVGSVAFFDETNTEQTVTHKFFIRFLKNATVTSEDWILFNDKYYDIVGVENINQQDEFYLIRANIRGGKNREGNKV